MTKSTIIPATPSNRKCWTTNQCVSIGYTSSKQFLVTSRQNRSTPGVYTEVYLKQNTCYGVSVSGQALGNSKAFVFVYNPATKKRLIPNYTLLPSNCFGCAEAQFVTPPCANEYICLYIGVLFTSPCNGQQFSMQEIRLTASGASNLRNYQNTQPLKLPADGLPTPPNNCPPTNCPPNYCPPNNCPPTNCPAEDEDEDDDCGVVETHHHHYMSSPNDPYYTYQTEPNCKQSVCKADERAYSKQAYVCPPTVTRPCSPVPCTPTYQAPVPCQTEDPITIKDLQDHLNSMIASMK